MVITAVLPDRPEGYSCSDCGHVFKTCLACAEHAFNNDHMGGRSCLLCSHFFRTLDDVRAHHVSYHEAGPPKRADEATSTTTTKYPDHFSPQHWRQSNDMEAALRDRPGHGYPWASPALSEDVCALLTPELLSTQRLAHHGFPLSATAHARSPTTTTWRNSPLPLPTPSSARKTYAALVIDCEMVQLADGAQDLVRISVVDLVSGAALLNHLVQPTGRVRQWNARVSGVHPQLLRAARDDPAVTVLAGWPDARLRLFALADAHTVLLGHALWNDLKILRVVAPRVVDSAVLTAQAVFGRDVDVDAGMGMGVGMGGARLHFPRTWSLKACCAAMGVAVQRSGVAHDSLEDALATRELVLWCLTKPGALRAWGVQAREEHERKMEALRVKREAEAEARKAEEQRKKQEALEERLAAMKLGEEVLQAAVARVEHTWS